MSGFFVDRQRILLANRSWKYNPFDMYFAYWRQHKTYQYTLWKQALSPK